MPKESTPRPLLVPLTLRRAVRRVVACLRRGTSHALARGRNLRNIGGRDQRLGDALRFAPYRLTLAAALTALMLVAGGCVFPKPPPGAPVPSFTLTLSQPQPVVGTF